MNPATVDESRSRHHPWWKSKYVIYDIMIHILVIASNVATFLHLQEHSGHGVQRRLYGSH
ncbi:unnamed protein product [Arabidopsis lyrata]|nr:unnamed protein product [Arabidopsis lyrata]